MLTREKWKCLNALEHYLNQQGIDLDSVLEEDIEIDESARIYVVGGAYIEGVEIVKGNMRYFTPLEEDSSEVAIYIQFGGTCDTFTLEGKEYQVLVSTNYAFGREDFSNINTWKCYKALEQYFTQQNINLNNSNIRDVGVFESKTLYMCHGKSLELKCARITMKIEGYEWEYYVPLPEHNSEIEQNLTDIVEDWETITVENVLYYVIYEKEEIEPSGDW
jgi:hypothetical protein